jgi:deoxyribodipyrimidine photolyase-related protein
MDEDVSVYLRARQPRMSDLPMYATSSRSVRNLVLVLGDQLDSNSAALDGFDPAQDLVWMAEVAEESTHVWTHKARIAIFLSGMRHFRDALRAREWTVLYRQLDDSDNAGTLAAELTRAIRQLRPQRLILVEAGEWRVALALEDVSQLMEVPLEIRGDRHFICTRDEFAAHARGRKQLRMEFFYREMRRKQGVLMDGDQPVGGAWNFDAENRESFGKKGPANVVEPIAFPPDDITSEVLALVERTFPQHPGSLKHFDWPVTPKQARAALDDFIQHRLPHFGQFQDAMWSSSESLFSDGTGRAQTFLYHSRLSAAMNLKLLDPREVISAAEREYRAGRASVASVEGFIRQILGWREYVRGVYWDRMPEYLELNALNATARLPGFFWTADTEMRCLREVIGQTLAFGYAHHIQRLMVTGLFTLLLGVRPQRVHEWYLAVYVDAVEWVELPNTLGMSQFGDGGIMASKPYVASGKYIQRMSNYCAGCRFNPALSVGADACPFTTLYWDFLLRHETLLRKNQRMSMQLKNLARLTVADREAISQQAERIKSSLLAS